MKYLPEFLRQEYDRMRALTRDVPELREHDINTSDVLRAYIILADYFANEKSENAETMLVGLRDAGLLHSAIDRQDVGFANKYKYDTPQEICATLFFGLVKDHAFLDGNKRTALLVLLYQLQLFRLLPKVKAYHFENLVVSVAENSVPDVYEKQYRKFEAGDDAVVRTIADVLRGWTAKKDASWDVEPTIRAFCKALEQYGVQCDYRSNGNLHFERRITANGDSRSLAANMRLSGGGTARTIGPSKTREILENLELYQQFASYKDILKGEDPLYELVSRYEVPLGRLKDK
ncbi:MAG: Fic family protein [Oscillospiraceae bacterium]|jgi:death-on-curing protein|nr:Fic family protein [Oscillospiraceae bacterium]